MFDRDGRCTCALQRSIEVQLHSGVDRIAVACEADAHAIVAACVARFDLPANARNCIKTLGVSPPNWSHAFMQAAGLLLDGGRESDQEVPVLVCDAQSCWAVQDATIRSYLCRFVDGYLDHGHLHRPYWRAHFATNTHSATNLPVFYCTKRIGGDKVEACSAAVAPEAIDHDVSDAFSKDQAPGVFSIRLGGPIHDQGLSAHVSVPAHAPCLQARRLV